MKKNKYILLLISLIFIITGCNKNNDTEKESYATCTRDVYASDAGADVEIKYYISYDKDENIKVLKTTEKITSTKEDVLKKYEAAYKKVYEPYKDLKYYENKIENDKYTLTSITTINYEKIDMDKLMKIEGTEDNVKVTNGKIKLSDWKEFAKKYGTTCK